MDKVKVKGTLKVNLPEGMSLVEFEEKFKNEDISTVKLNFESADGGKRSIELDGIEWKFDKVEG